MTFAAGIWLIGLVPWAALSAWLLWGRPPRLRVPFLDLWRGPVAVRRQSRRALERPPVAIAALLLAMLLAILAAAGPRLSSSGHGKITVLVDRGLTMSATPGGEARYVTLARSVRERLGSARIDVVDLLTGEMHSGAAGDLTALVANWKRTAIDTRPSIGPAVAQQMAPHPGPVIVLTDHPVAMDDARLVAIAPRGRLNNVGISAIAARERPAAQVMVEILNESAAMGTDLTVTSAGGTVTRHIDLPQRGARVRAFVDLPALGAMVEARLATADDSDADNAAYLAREGAPPRLEARSNVPQALAHFLHVYEKARPANEASRTVAVAARRADLGGEPGAVWEIPAAQNGAAGAIHVESHPVTELVDWPAIVKSAALTPSAPNGFLPVVTLGGRTAVAVQESPARQVWVGFNSEDFAPSPDFVVFWSNVFTWLSGDADSFAAHPVTFAPPAWKAIFPAPVEAQANAWPNVYERDGAAAYAMNALDTAQEAEGTLVDGGEKDLGISSGEGSSVRPHLLLGAIALGVLAAATWRG